MTTYVLGDVHGHFERAVELLSRGGLIDENREWSGGDSTLWFVGDFFDRGPDGASAVHLAMRLQSEAERAGGTVGSLIGNHELMVIGVARFADEAEDLVNLWLANGGRVTDLKRLGEEGLDWIGSLPAAGLAGPSLLLHCDSAFYASLGGTIEDANAEVTRIVKNGNREEFTHLLQTFFQRFELDDREKVDSLLGTFSARRIVHGHTPIPVALEREPTEVTEAHVYADGRCINVDGGMYLGGPGFLHVLED